MNRRLRIAIACKMPFFLLIDYCPFQLIHTLQCWCKMGCMYRSVSLTVLETRKITSIRDDKSHFYERSILIFNMLSITFTSKLRFFFLFPHLELTHFKTTYFQRALVSSVVQPYLNYQAGRKWEKIDKNGLVIAFRCDLETRRHG